MADLRRGKIFRVALLGASLTLWANPGDASQDHGSLDFHLCAQKTHFFI
jgi:hypothetical protein